MAMSIETDNYSIFLEDDCQDSGLLSARAPLKEADVGLLNPTFIFDGAMHGPDKLSTRSLDQLSSIYNSRPASPISERERAICDLYGFSMEAQAPPQTFLKPKAPVPERSLCTPAAHRELAVPAPPLVYEKYCQTCVSDFEILSLLESKVGARKPILKRRKRINKKTGRDPTPPPEAEAPTPAAAESLESPPLRVEPRNSLGAKVAKLGSFWRRQTKLLPNTFKVSFLCPVRKQAEFLDFSLKEILLEEHHQNGPRPRIASEATDTDSSRGSPAGRKASSAVLQ